MVSGFSLAAQGPRFSPSPAPSSSRQVVFRPVPTCSYHGRQFQRDPALSGQCLRVDDDTLFYVSHFTSNDIPLCFLGWKEITGYTPNLSPSGAEPRTGRGSSGMRTLSLEAEDHGEEGGDLRKMTSLKYEETCA